MKKNFLSNMFTQTRSSSERNLQGARLFVLFASLAGFLWVALYYFVFNAPMVAFIIMIGSGIGLFIYGISFKLKNGELIANLSILSFLSTLILVEYFTGGISSPNNYWLLMIPVVAFFFVGFARGLFWSLVVAGSFVFFAYLEFMGISPINPIIQNKQHIWMIAKIFSAYFIMITITAIYEYSRVYFEKNLANKANDLSMSENKLKKTLVYLNKLNEDLRQLNETKSEFTAMLSHELRTPLTAITQGVKIILDGKTGDINDEQRTFLEITERNVQRLSRLVNDVLDFQKLDTRRMDFYWQKNNINDVVKEVEHDIANFTGDKNLTIETDLCFDMQAVIFDKDKIIQVITNLLSNAIKYTSEGKIILSTHVVDDGIKVSVTDSGIGIAQDNISKLFTSFTQLEKGKTKKPGGSGLGLAISKKIVEAHKGQIWVESEVNRGSVFSFVIPFARRNSIILIVPEEIILTTCKEFLERKGCMVISADEGVMGLEAITKNKPDLIILDVGIDDISVAEFIDKLRGLSDFSSIPLLLLTDEEGEDPSIVRQENEGPIAWIKKPFELSKFYDKIQQMTQ